MLPVSLIFTSGIASNVNTRMTTYSGLVLDFGGVVTTDFYGALSAFSARAGLDDLFDAVVIS